MTQEQIEFIENTIPFHLDVFLRVKTEQFNNVWTEDCERLFSETRIGVIKITENYLLNPIRTFAPNRRTFAPENELIRVEIAERITRLFLDWKTLN